jgi:cytoskeletal protein CcmA (bactofilin family)
MLGNKRMTGAPGGTTLIAHDTEIVGDVHFSGDLEIEGVVKGNIIARSGQDATVRIVDKGKVEGEIRVPEVVVNGTVEGDVHSSKLLELASHGRVQGNVFYASVEMAAGSEVNGSMTHTANAEQGIGKTPDPSVEVTDVSELPGPAKLASAKLD